MIVRRLVVAAAVAGTLAAVTGCNAAALDKRELVVYFTQTTPRSEQIAAQQACAHVTPEATAEPITKSLLPSDQVGDIRFLIDHANDKELAELTECLNKQPGVSGVDTPDLTD